MQEPEARLRHQRPPVVAHTPDGLRHPGRVAGEQLVILGRAQEAHDAELDDEVVDDFLGLLLGLAGIDSQTGQARFVFGVPELLDGVDVVVLAVGASWLPLSAKQADYTNALAKKYAGKNVVFYFIATDSTNSRSKNFASDDSLRKFAFDNKLTVPVLRDADGVATLKKYSIDQVPSFVILDKAGVRSGEPFGGIDPKYDITIPISKVIDRLL